MSNDKVAATFHGKQLDKWADKAMWTAEPSERDKGIRASLVYMNPDPLGQIAALNQMYVGEAISDLSLVTDTMRREILSDLQNTVLKMPLEVVNIHILISGIHRGITHQMVRQRTAAYAQESMRFAVKEDMADAVAYPPSLEGTWSLNDYAVQQNTENILLGLASADDGNQEHWDAFVHECYEKSKGDQRQRFIWDEAVGTISKAYLELINTGMPAEEARGLAPTNSITKIHYTSNLRNFLVEMGKRVSDQAQFEWRKVIVAIVGAMREFGQDQFYWTRISMDEYKSWSGPTIYQAIHSEQGLPVNVVKIKLSSYWQFEEITKAIKPIDWQLGHRAFGAKYDRGSRYAERIDAFADMGVSSSRWLNGAPEYNIPGINPDEWLLDANSARLKEGEEFDIFGQRVGKGKGWHWTKQYGGVLYNEAENKYATLFSGPTDDINDILIKKGE